LKSGVFATYTNALKAAALMLLVVALLSAAVTYSYAVGEADAETDEYAEGDADDEADEYTDDEDGGETDKYAKPPKLTAKSAILIDAKTGNVLYEKKADTKHSPASCTKIMTALLAIENLGTDEIVTVAPEASGVEGSSVGLVPDEEIRAEDLFYAALLESGNDAATALAIGVDGSVEKFADHMNERVEQLGLTHSHFANPHGLDDPEHYTTARDLAFIARDAMQNALFRKYVSTYEYTMPKTNLQPERLLHNSNRMLYEKNRVVTVYGEEVSVKYPDSTGIKTGYTSKAGNCLVSGVNRDGLELISVILKSQGMDQYSDTMSLLEYGLHNFKEVTYMKKGESMFERPVIGAGKNHVNLVLADDLTVTVNNHDNSSYEVDGEVTGETTDSGIMAPIKAGDVFGKAWIKNAEGETLSTVDLVAENSIAAEAEKKPNPVSAVISDEGVGVLSLVLRVVGVVCLVAVLIVVITIIKNAARRRKRRRNRMYGAKLSSSVDSREVRRIKNLNKPSRRRR
jgi:D-alanyl-D-alanine carboxypeptidase (penicillin-binding protein 5/6)